MTSVDWLHRSSGPTVLDEVLDAGAMSKHLAPFLDGATDLRVVAAEVVGRSGDERVVVAYRTARGAGEGPALIAKLYVDPERAPRMHALLERLHELDAAGEYCGVPRPVAYLPELGMSVYVAAGGRTLDQLNGAERRDGVVAAARWLSTLHRSGIPMDRHLDLAVEATNVRYWAELVARLHPPVAALTRDVLCHLELLADRIAEPASVPVHKDFQYQHVLFEKGRVVVIDLDEMRAGDAAFDVAHFAANLRLLALREEMSGDDAAGLESAFVGAYASQTGYEPDLRHEYFHAYTCVKIAKQLVRSRGPAPAPVGAELARQVMLILEAAVRCRRP